VSEEIRDPRLCCPIGTFEALRIPGLSTLGVVELSLSDGGKDAARAALGFFAQDGHTCFPVVALGTQEPDEFFHRSGPSAVSTDAVRVGRAAEFVFLDVAARSSGFAAIVAVIPPAVDASQGSFSKDGVWSSSS
jgi:hypothetical protein